MRIKRRLRFFLSVSFACYFSLFRQLCVYDFSKANMNCVFSRKHKLAHAKRLYFLLAQDFNFDLHRQTGTQFIRILLFIFLRGNGSELMLFLLLVLIIGKRQIDNMSVSRQVFRKTSFTSNPLHLELAPICISNGLS